MANGQNMKKAVEELLAQFDIRVDDVEQEPESNDFSELIWKTREKLDELHERGDDLLKKMGMTKEQVENYAADPKNFTPQQWEALQKVKDVTEQLKNQTMGVLGEEQIHHAIDESAADQRHRFGKKKRWIPI